jgi:Alpha/beta hydrolase domain
MGDLMSVRAATRIAVLVALTAIIAPAGAAVPNPTVTGPIPVNAPPGDPSHDYPQLATQVDIASQGYVEEEYFFEGTATRYSTPPLATGGVVSSGHPYKTRMIVRRPISAERFNGIVIVEWVNVTSGYNLDAMWQASFDLLMREGYAYVGVSAQRVGVQVPPSGLTAWSPTRYGTLDVTAGNTVPPDTLSYDIFSQAAQAIRQPMGVNPLGGLPVRLIVAAGVSQSQGRLVLYHNSIHPLAGVYDGFYLVLGLGGRLRTDLAVKVFKVNTENDVLLLGEAAARQPDSDRLRTWEIAGTSHVSFQSAVFRRELLIRDGLPQADTTVCSLPALSHIPTRYVLNAVYGHLVRWIVDGSAPPIAPRIDLISVSPAVAARDTFGNALGGIRLAQHAVPTATNTGVNSGPGFCFLFGSHVPFDAATLAALYRNHGQYVSAVDQATNKNLAAGYILGPEAEATVEEAAHSDIGKK